MKLEDFSAGNDIEKIERFEKYTQNREDAFLKRIYTQQEIDYCFSQKNIAEHLAVRYSAKEATYKALCSLGITDVSISQIEVVRDEIGVPSIRLLIDKYPDLEFRLSLSHGNGNALATSAVIKVNRDID